MMMMIIIHMSIGTIIEEEDLILQMIAEDHITTMTMMIITVTDGEATHV